MSSVYTQLPRRGFLLALALLAGPQPGTASSMGPIGTYYATDFHGFIVAIQGSNVGITPQLDQVYGEEAIAVLGSTVTTTGADLGATGGNYTGAPSLTLTPSGITNGNPVPPDGLAFDAATKRNTVVCDIQNAVGMTYQASNNSLWIQGLFDGVITDYAMGGNVLFSFSTGLPFTETGLTMDVDGTLWFADEGTNTLEHFATDGTNLGNFTVTSPFDDPLNISGAEISGLPEPGTLVLMAIPLAVILWRRYSIRCNSGGPDRS